MSLPLNDLSFISFSTIAIVALGGTVMSLTKVPLPDKVVWSLGLGLIGLNGLLNSLYAVGGYYMALFPVLFWSKSVSETTGILALIIGAYSTLHKGQISAHWYSLPTGCTPLAMAAQYVPSHFIQATLCGAYVLYSIYLLNTGKLDSIGKKVVVPIAIILVATLVYFKLALTEYLWAYNAAVALACLLLTQIALNKDISLSIGKKKIL